uniref:Cilia- and flagella-associated protein 65 n=1 Tax=Neogobius melanostomus TaxID=47308 RepID=A0A8C6V525_9GOBI
MLAETRFHRHLDEHQRSTLPNRNPKPGFQCSRNHDVDNEQHVSGQRSSFLGIEMETELVWDNWDLGRVFTKTLIIRNTQSTLQRILFRPPLTKYFASLARQKLVLGPGTSFSVPVTFKPLKRCPYEDTIEFQGKDDSFQVLLRASALCHAIDVPETVQLPYCAVQHSTHATFMLKNVSKLTTLYHWKYAPPFTLSPEQGHVKPGQEHNITVTFHPQDALVFQQPVTCKFGTQADKLESCCRVLLQGGAKHPYLEFTRSTKKILELDFGYSTVGQTLHIHFEISNPTVVPASFTLSRLPGVITLSGSVFNYDVTGTEVAPGASLKATATFTPTAADTTSVEYLSIISTGAINTSILKLIGSCRGPQVLLSSSVVDFGKVEPGQEVAYTVKLVNTSQAKAVFQWDIGCSGHSVFSIQPAGGTVPPQSHITLNVSYRPAQSIIHYRRLACLILNREPVFLDLVGNCHSEKPIEQLLLGTSYISESNQQSDGAAHEAVTPMAEYFRSCLGDKDPLSSSPCQISITPNEFVFNQRLLSLPDDLTSQKSMTVVSYSKVKLRLEWTAPSDSCFSVSPLSCELPPLKTTSFRVIYFPKQLNTLHGAQLECFVYPMENDHINESVLPSCVTVRATGHSFEPGKQHWVPQCSLEPRLVEFTPVQITSYRTAHLKNTADLPLTFHVNHDHDQKLAEAASLVVVPSCGLIEPHSHQILCLRSVPTEDGPKEGFHLQLDLNASEYAEHLTIVSQSEQLHVSLEDDGRLHFQPTAVNSLMQRLHQIRNLSRQALRFQWRIPEQEQGLISVKPDAGVLHPNESLTQTWSFTPLEEKAYTLTPILTVCPMEFPEQENVCLPLEVTGTGCTGCLEAKEEILEVTDILVGECRTISIPVINKSPCPVYFCVTVEQKLLEKGTVYNPNIDLCALQVHDERVRVASASTIMLQSTLTPPEKAQYMWILRYQTINANGSLSAAIVLCEVHAKGVFPTLQIIDVCGRDSMSNFSKNHLWRLLSLNDLNKSLQSSPWPTELTYTTPTRHSLYPTPSVFTKAIMDLNFSGAPLNSDPSTFILILYNPGTVPVEWAFLFPEDQKLDLELRAESGAFTSTELYQMKVQDNHLFSVKPRSGKLMRGQQRAVTFTYSHDFVGMDRFPVLLKISYGREIMLTFQGITVEVDRPFLNVASKKHIFAPVAIGDYNPPKQVYHFYNRGAVPVHFEVDKAILSQVQEENFNHPVLRCLNPDGDIPPGEAAILEWIFSPLEAKLYTVDISIHILNGESTVVRFEGFGLNSKMKHLSDTCANTDAQPLSCRQRVPFQPTFLSEDIVDFGDIVVSSQSSKMLFLSNSHKDAVHFEWVLPQLNDQPQVLDIIPNRGSLRPGEMTHLVLTLSATDYPTVYNSDLVCKITCEAALAHYHSAVQQTEEEKGRQEHEFTITDKALIDHTVVLTEKEAESIALRQQAFWNKYKTLPPIRGSNDCNTVRSLSIKMSRAERRALKELERAEAQSDPKPPKPCLLHLWVTAQSYGPLEFLTQSPEQLNTQYRPNKTGRIQKQMVCREESSITQGQKKDMSSHLFTSALRDILEDATLVDNLLTLASTPVTYNLPVIPTPCPSPKPASSDTATEPPRAAADESCEDAAGKMKPVRAELADLTEEVCRCALQNLMMEVMSGELDPK